MRYQPRHKADIWINGCTKWTIDWVHRGWDPYYINIMFHPLPGKPPAIISQMKHVIHAGFYSRFCTEFARNPRSEAQQKYMPKLWLFPDRPCRKTKMTIPKQFFAGNDNGLHFNGPLLLPPISRFKERPVDHLEANRSRYERHGIQRIHVARVYDIPGIIDYAAKTIKYGTASMDDIFVLPKRLSELPGKIRHLASSDRRMNDIEADEQWLKANYDEGRDIGRFRA